VNGQQTERIDGGTVSTASVTGKLAIHAQHTSVHLDGRTRTLANVQSEGVKYHHTPNVNAQHQSRNDTTTSARTQVNGLAHDTDEEGTGGCRHDRVGEGTIGHKFHVPEFNGEE
jgi:hypothetical protein